MRRWNGWGDDGIAQLVPPRARAVLSTSIGPAEPPRDATIADVLAAVPASRLPAHRLVTDGAEARLRHARGQSLPDWIALRSGRIGTFPDGVAFPGSEDDVRSLLRFAAETGASLVPFGGGTSVVGHVNPLPDARPVLTVDLSRMCALLRLDETSRLATFGAGVFGPDLEALLGARGFTLGHFPQSFEFSTLGGWVVTRSSGQQSLGFGRIERLFAGGRLVSPAGTLDLPPFPASAAGPDLREVVLGSEGRLGILTEATVRITPRAAREEFLSLFFPDWERGLRATREIVQARLPLSMLRLSTPHETETALLLAGHERMVSALEVYLAFRGAGAGKCQLLAGVTGDGPVEQAARREALALAWRHGAASAPGAIGRAWVRNRFRGPYLRNSLWEAGYAVDTLETATTWDRVDALVGAIEGALAGALSESGERVHVFTHLSHAYPSGSSLYTTYAFRVAADPDETLGRWRLLKDAASRAIVAGGGTISHQHGVGLDHAPYLAAEKGELGVSAISDLCRRFDPKGVMNPGKLIR